MDEYKFCCLCCFRLQKGNELKKIVNAIFYICKAL